LSPAPDAIARRRLAAGEAAAAAGEREQALSLLEQAGRRADDEAVRTRAAHLRGRIMVWSGSPLEAKDLLIAEAERTRGRDAVSASAMLADAANACTVSNAFYQAEELAQRAVTLRGDGGDPLTRAPLLAMLGWALLLRGKAPRARPLLREAEALAEGVDPLGLHGPWQHLLLLARLPLGELERAHVQSAALSRRARDAGALAILAPTLVVLAEAAYRLGDWEAATAATREAIAVAGDSRQHSWHGYALSIRTRLAGAGGRPAEGQRAARAALGIVRAQHIPSGSRFVHGALGFLELSRERIDAAIAELETVERMAEGSGHADPTLVPWVPDLLEACVRAGRFGDAGRLLERLERQAASAGTPFAAVMAARSRGLLHADFEPAFVEALALDDARPMPFERARTLLAFGRLLHRARRRAEARLRLREALDGFQDLGADAWAAQAQRELRAAGARRRGPRAVGLTPQESRVAAGVRRGASNREIAAELFLTPKTIEFHLHQIYRKAGVRSRTQLVAALTREAGADGDAPGAATVRPLTA
ncbi:MAG: helix-turn-helix transcriptional regulator, partial [Solirubrobacteraceae bacterium]